MIRTPRSAALAVLAAAALVSIPGTAFADASAAGPVPGPGYNNGIVINQIFQYAGGDIYNADDDGIVENPPGTGVPFAQFRITNSASSALERVSQQGADYPPLVYPGVNVFLQTGGPSSAEYRAANGSGTVFIDATNDTYVNCHGEGSLECRPENTPAGWNLIVTGG